MNAVTTRQAQGEVLLQMLQISDLHIGTPDAHGNAAVSPRLDGWLRHLPILDGLLGHHVRGLTELVNAVDAARTGEGPEMMVLVTGDMTRCGAADEQDLAAQYLLDEWAPLPPPVPGAGPIVVGGLNLQQAPCSTSGNHDHWGGLNLPLGRMRSLYSPARFGHSPLAWIERMALGRDHELTMLGVDTDRDVRAVGARRLLARGHFETQLDQLDQQLWPRRPHERRVLLLHHSPSHQGVTLTMSHASRQRLKRFVRDHQVGVLLSGHTHASRHRKLHDDWGAVLAHEFNCGSSTAVDTVQPHWNGRVRRLFARKGLPENALLMHRVMRQPDGGLVWRCEPHYRPQGGRFEWRGVAWEVPL